MFTRLTFEAKYPIILIFCKAQLRRFTVAPSEKFIIIGSARLKRALLARRDQAYKEDGRAQFEYHQKQELRRSGCRNWNESQRPDMEKAFRTIVNSYQSYNFRFTPAPHWDNEEHTSFAFYHIIDEKKLDIIRDQTSLEVIGATLYRVGSVSIPKSPLADPSMVREYLRNAEFWENAIRYYEGCFSMREVILSQSEANSFGVSYAEYELMTAEEVRTLTPEYYGVRYRR